jgi:predicted O-methyltransferase YrrM
MPLLRSARFVTHLGGVPRRQARALLQETAVAEAHAIVAEGEREYRAACPGLSPGTIWPDKGALLYALVRATRPTLVVETGTANGSSTVYLLSALIANGHGELVSIDLPFVGPERAPVVAGSSIGEYDASPIPPGREAGWMVPDSLRTRWSLRLGDAAELLTAITGPVDVFFHDSLHTREHMLLEFETMWPRLARDGLLLADDVFQRRHDALAAFARDVGRPFLTFRSVGGIAREERTG